MYNADRHLAAEDLRELATWYRYFAERAGSTTIWAARLRLAEDLELEADKLRRRPAHTLKEESARPS